uniref:Uncharacterized protein n=1 Tax=Mycena chlorophos TaxID=658473 RepID=A0ABQ0MC60_MYCCL|nr:predicted protein [Mycena chlorophos]
MSSLSDSLTPSPSPPPPRPVPTARRPGRPKKPPKKAPPPVRAPKKGDPVAKAPPSAGLDTNMDSGSELSELTEDEEGAAKNNATPHKEPTVDVDGEDNVDAELVVETEEDEEEQEDDESAKPKGKARARSKKAPGRSTAANGVKRKRSNIIPPTMWGWVPPQTQLEEEEEEQPPPRAMEEESDSDHETKERDNTEEADETTNENGMDVDEPAPAETAPIETAAAATLLDLLAVASPELVNGDNTEDEDEGEDEVDVDDPPVVSTEVIKQITRRASAARPPPADDRPVSPMSQDGEEADGPSREVSPVSGEDEAEPADKSDVEIDVQEKSDGEEETKSDDDADADVEMDVQPAHRAEALDVLAGIELKYALLRQTIYIDRMEGLAWEEALVQAGTHPEMLHIQRELTARRDRRLELATRKRSLECVDAERKRTAAEHGVWSWWKLARDDLQTDMITETNRKRRKMERDRRGTERPYPLRRIPAAPPTQAATPAVPLDLRMILKGEPSLPQAEEPARRIRTRSQRNAEPRPNENAPPALVFPDIPSMSAADIEQDLSYMIRPSQPPAPPPVPAPHDMAPARHQGQTRMGPVEPPRLWHPVYDPTGGYPPNHPMAQQYLQQQQQQQGFRQPHHHAAPIQHPQQPPFEQVPYGGVYPPPRRPASPGRWPKGEWGGTETRVIGDGRMEQPQGRVIGMGMPLARHSEDEERERMKRERERDRERDREMDRRQQPDYAHLHRAPQHHSIVGPHHHHHHGVHHHVVHNHHPSNPPRPSLSPRASREFDSRPQHQAELINIGPSKPPAQPDAGARYDRDHPDYRKRALPLPDDRDRPIATPFVMGASYNNRMRTPPPVNPPSQSSRSSSRALEDAFRMPPSSSTSVGYLGDAHRPPSHPSSPRRYSQSSQGPPLPPSSAGPSSSRAPPPPSRQSSGYSPPLHRTLPPPPSTSSPSPFGGAPSGSSRYGASSNGPPMMSGNRAPTPGSRSPVLHRPERERLPSPPPLPSSSKMMVGAMVNGPLAPSAYSRTTTPTVTADEKAALRNDSPFVSPFAGLSNPAGSGYGSKPSQPPSDRDRDVPKVGVADKISNDSTKLPPAPGRVSPPPVLAPPPTVLPPLPTQPKSERIS